MSNKIKESQGTRRVSVDYIQGIPGRYEVSVVNGNSREQWSVSYLSLAEAVSAAKEYASENEFGKCEVWAFTGVLYDKDGEQITPSN